MTDFFIEQQQHVLREVRAGLDKRHQDRAAATDKANSEIPRLSAGVVAKPADLVVLRESGRTLYRIGHESKIEHKRRKGSWRDKEVLQHDVEVVGMEGRQLLHRVVSACKPDQALPYKVRGSTSFFGGG